MHNRNVASIGKVIAVSATVFAGVFLPSWRTPYFCDDNTYRLEVLHGPDPLRIGCAGGMESDFPAFTQKIANLAHCGLEHYRKENGRFLCAVPLRLFVAVPRWAYAAFNGAAFVFICLLAWRLTGLSDRWLCAVAAASVFSLLKADAVLWLAASINYLYPIVFVLYLASVFVADRNVSKSAWLFAASFLAAGGHEIISVPVCVVLCMWWARRCMAERRLTMDGRSLMSLGFFLGTAAIFLSPASPIFRANAEASSSMAYKVLCKVMTLSFCSLGSPFFLPTCIMLVLAALLPRYRCVFSGRSGWMALLWAVIMLFTLAFGTICARASWPANVMTMLLFFAMLPKFTAGWRPCIKRTAAFMMCVLALATLVNTAISSHVHHAAYESAMANYSSDENDIYRIHDRCDWLFGFLFDRSVPPLGIVQVADGEDCTNGIFARLLGRRRIIGLHNQEADAVKDLSKFCIPENRLEGVEGEWYSVPGRDLLVSPMAASSDGSAAGVWRANVEYRGFPPASGEYVRLLREILVQNLKDNLGGWPILRTMIVFEDSVRDVLYTSLYCLRPALCQGISAALEGL